MVPVQVSSGAGPFLGIRRAIQELLGREEAGRAGSPVGESRGTSMVRLATGSASMGTRVWKNGLVMVRGGVATVTVVSSRTLPSGAMMEVGLMRAKRKPGRERS